MKPLISIVLLLFPAFEIMCQNPSLVEQNLKDYELAEKDSLRCEFLIQAAFNSAHSNSQEGIILGNRALKMAKSMGSKKLLADCHNSLGICFDSQGGEDSAMHHYTSSIKLFESTGKICEVAKSLSNIGNLQRKKGLMTEALKSYGRAIEIAEECGTEEIKGSLHYSIGTCYNSLREFNKAIEYFDFALANIQKYEDAPTLCNIYNGLGNAYLGLSQNESSKRYFNLALQCLKDTKNEYNLAYCYENIAQFQKATGNLDSAIVYSQKALAIFERLNAAIDIVYEKVLLSQFLIDAGEYGRAESLLKQALPLSYSANFPRERETLFTLLSIAQEKQGDFRNAYYSYKNAIELRDSLNLDKQEAELKRLANQFETDKRDRQIAEEKALALHHQLESERQKQQKYYFMTAVFLLGFISVVLVNRYLSNKRSARKLQEKNKIIAREKEKAEKSERHKQQFLSNMSHEIRTPVNAINGLSRLLLDKNHDQQTMDYLKAINHSGENLLIVLNDVLDLAKIEAGKMKVARVPFILKEEITNTAFIFSQRAREKGLSLKINISKSLPDLVEGDAVRLSQVLSNLISNAIKFTEKGSITINAASDKPGLVTFSVEDTGTGIAEEEIEMIFENFIQSSNSTKGGTGLGLPIAKNLIELMGGSLKVKSAPGEGSVFSFTLPLPPFHKEIVPTVLQEIPICMEELHFVVAEDVEYNFWVTESVLKKYFPKVSIYRAHNGEEVLDLLKEDEYDLILMDLQMPVMDGVETARQIQLSDYKIPVIGLTANIVQEYNQQALEAGMRKIITKPFKDEDLVKCIHTVLLLTPEEIPDAIKQEVKAVEVQRMFSLWMPGHLEKMIIAMANRDVKEIGFLVHKMRPQLLHSGFAHLEPQLLAAEQKTKWDNELEEILKSIIYQVEERLRITSIS